MNCLIAQSGGPTSAINATLAGICAKALKSKNMKIYGGINGIEGIIKDKIVDIGDFISKDNNLNLLKTTPSSFLGSCRYKLESCDKNTTDFEKIFDVFKKYNIKYFLYIGGNDSMDTILKLKEYQLKNNNCDVILVGVPKTIDNDLIGVDHTPGFGSAAKYIATTLKEIAYDTSVYDMNSIVVVEIMGRNSGWLTLSAGLANENGKNLVDIIYLPETPFSYEKLIEDIKNVQKYKKQIVIAVSEGIRFESGKLISESEQKDVFGHGQLGGAASIVADYIKTKLNTKVRAVEINVLQRCAAHCLSFTDIDESFKTGEKAVQVAYECTSGVMIANKRKEGEYGLDFYSVDISLVANKEKKVPEEFMNSDKNNISQEGMNYLKPLIMGEVNVPFKNGLPVYLDIKPWEKDI